MSSTILMRGIPFDAQETYNSNTGETEYDRVAYSADVADWFDTMFSTGIVIPGGGTFTTELKVESQSGMHVKINPGRAVINGRLGYIEEAQVLDLDDPSTSNRIDRIVVELNLTDRNFYVKVLKGTPSSSPVAVAPTKTDTIYQLVLADVLVTANVSGTANITDQRNNAELCGISNVRVGVYIPPSDSSENIGVSGDASEELGGATNVQDALNNIYQVGDIKATMRKDLSDKWLMCNGDVINKTDYPDLAGIDGLTEYVSRLTFYCSGGLPSDVDVSLNPDRWDSITDTSNSTFEKVANVCKVGTDGYALAASWKLNNTGEKAWIIYFINGISDILDLPLDLNEWVCVKQAFPYNTQTYVRNQRVVNWLNNTFIVMASYWKTEDSGVTGSIGTVYFFSGNTLNENSNFKPNKITFTYNGSNSVNRQGALGSWYADGKYTFYYSYYLNSTSIIVSSSLSTLSPTNINSTGSSSGGAFVEVLKQIGSTCFSVATSSTGTYGLNIELGSTVISVSNPDDVLFEPVSAINLDDDESTAYVFCMYSKSTNAYGVLFKATETTLQYMSSSGWVNATSMLDFHNFRIGTSIPTAANRSVIIKNGELYMSGRKFKDIKMIANIPYNESWDSDSVSISGFTGYKPLNEGMTSIIETDSNGNYYTLNTEGIINYDNSIKLPELTADDTSAYYVKVKN